MTRKFHDRNELSEPQDGNKIGAPSGAEAGSDYGTSHMEIDGLLRESMARITALLAENANMKAALQGCAVAIEEELGAAEPWRGHPTLERHARVLRRARAALGITHD